MINWSEQIVEPILTMQPFDPVSSWNLDENNTEEVEDFFSSSLTLTNAIPPEMNSEEKVRLTQKLIVSSFSFPADDREKIYLNTKLEALFSEPSREHMSLLLRDINAQLNVHAGKAKLVERAALDTESHQETYEVVLNIDSSEPSKSVLLFKSEEPSSHSAFGAIFQCGETTFYVVSKPVSHPTQNQHAILVAFFKDSSTADETDSAFEQKQWRGFLSIYSELKKAETFKNSDLKKKFEAEAFKNLRGFNYGSIFELWHNDEIHFLQAYAWKRLLKENCQLTALRLAVAKGNFQFINRILDHITQQKSFESGSLNLVFPDFIFNHLQRLDNWKFQVKDYNDKLKEIQQEAVEFRKSIQSLQPIQGLETPV